MTKLTPSHENAQLWPYQLEPANAVLNSVTKDLGLTITLIISRQAGKDETLANLVAYILRLFSHIEAKIVFINPTYKPQTENSLIRLESRLDANPLTRGWKKRGAYICKLGKAMISFLSGDKKARIVSATANKLLIVNETQDITPAKFDKDISPIGAYSNVTRLIVGTVWTSQTLLAREEDAAREEEKKDGIKRVFVYNCTDVRKHDKSYGAYADKEVAKLGREHPLVKTQYFCERIDSHAGISMRVAALSCSVTIPHRTSQHKVINTSSALRWRASKKSCSTTRVKYPFINEVCFRMQLLNHLGHQICREILHGKFYIRASNRPGGHVLNHGSCMSYDEHVGFSFFHITHICHHAD